MTLRDLKDSLVFKAGSLFGAKSDLLNRPLRTYARGSGLWGCAGLAGIDTQQLALASAAPDEALTYLATIHLLADLPAERLAAPLYLDGQSVLDLWFVPTYCNGELPVLVVP